MSEVDKSLSEVHERVAILETLVMDDDQSNIEAPAPAIAVDSGASFNYTDRNAYDTHWIEETVAMEKLDEILRNGESFINMVYTYRSCSKALPQVRSAEQPNRNQIYEGTYEVLEPEIKKLKDFMYFQRDTIKLFCDHVKRLAAIFSSKKKNEDFVVSETMIKYFIRMLDLFALLDALKNMKACLNNDFSFYKRAFSYLRRNLAADDQTQENHTLYLFLANQNSITTNLRTELQAIEGFDDVLALCVNQCADYLEADMYMLPTEKHCLLRVMPYALFLMDGDDNKHNIFKKKDLNLSRIARIFKKNPVVPLYGDMQITLESFIKRSPHFDEKVWGAGDNDQKIAQEYEIIHVLDATRAAHNEYIAKFANMLNDIKISRRQMTDPMQTLPPAECRDVTQVVLSGLRLLSDWSSKILQQSAWKYARPNNDPAIDTPVDYERVVKYNYTSAERFALVEFIAMTKGLAGAMMREDALLSVIMRRAIHDELQEFIQVSLREMIRAISKNPKKKTNIRAELLQLRAIAADWLNGTEPVDPALYGKKSSSKDDDKVQYPQRNVGPSATQLDLIRNIVYGLIEKKKEFSSSQVKELEEFYNRSYFYPHLLSMTSTIMAITDLADLWYREFYLELSKRLQFPIEMSLPWILTDHILESKDPSMMEFVLYPLDIYNDAANRALNRLRTRFLYDEVEAEVNLCFDQLLFKLSEQIFTHYKIQASTILLDKPYKNQLEVVYSTGKFNLPKSRYDVLVRQKHFKLLGRTLDISNLITQRLNTYLKQNIDYAISRFEASDITSVVELEGMLANIRLTHKMLSGYFELDPWGHFFSEVNESTSLVSFHGRIVLHIIFELMYDFLPNFNFNAITQRFIRAPFTFSQEVPREAMPKTNPSFLYGSKALTSAYANSNELHRKFFGNHHILALLRLVGKSGLPLVIGEVLRNMELKVMNVLSPYVRELMGGMPQSSKLPIHDYGTEGGYGYFQLKLKDIFTYPDLRPEVLHNFRIFGNGVVILNLLDLATTQFDSSLFVTTAPFLGYTPEDMTPSENESPLYANVQRVATVLQQKPDYCKFPAGLKDIVMNAWRADKFYRPITPHTSLFKVVLQKIDAMLNPVRAEWSGSAPDNGVLSVDTTTEFYRLWSALQFVVCLPTSSETDMSPHELFGDGLMWAGCTIIHFLGQQHRFDLFDFSYHILNVEEAAAVPCQKPHIKQFFKTVMLMRDINQGIFNTLNTYTHPVVNQWTVLHPPPTDQQDQTFLHPSEDTSHVTRSNSTSHFPITSPSSDSFTPTPHFDAPPPPALDDAPPPPSHLMPDFGAPPPPPPI